MDYDIAIIGAGICGLSAAISVQTQGKHFVVLEQSDRVGGHEYTITIKGKRVDIGFLFDAKGSALHDFVVQTLNLPIQEHRILYTSSFQNNLVIHNNDVPNGPFRLEIRRLYDLIEKMKFKSPYILMTCAQFLTLHHFSKDFINFVLKPAISILFLSGNEIGMRKPIPVIAHFLHCVISLLTHRYDPILWGMAASEEIAQQIVRQYKIPVQTNTSIEVLSKKDQGWILTDQHGRHICAKKVIFCCDAKETLRICAQVLTDWRFTFVRAYLRSISATFEDCTAYVHDFKGLFPPKTIEKKTSRDVPYHYTYIKETKWILSAVLDKDIYLSVSLDANLLCQKIPKKHVFYQTHWRHPGQDTFHLALCRLGWMRACHYQHLYFAGAVTYIIGHTYAYEAGREIGTLAS